MISRILTIGTYGFTQASFLAALRSAGVDVLVDVRARRGMRGRTYAFANAGQLVVSLQGAGIRYLHAKELAPSPVARETQHSLDLAAGVQKRQRNELGDAFVRAYGTECLSTFDPVRFINTHLAFACRPALFCVERPPSACHRSLLADRIALAWGVPREDLYP